MSEVLAEEVSLKEEALKLLGDPGLLYRLELAMIAPESASPLIGEDDNALLLLLILLAKGSVEVRGQSGAGKNSLVDHALSIFPRTAWEKIGGLTNNSLRYLEEGLKILYITERRGFQSGHKGEESNAEYDVKLGISEGEITILVPEIDPETERRTSTTHSVSIESFIFTTTEVSAPPELENRLTVLNVRDDTTQNAIVRDAQLRAARTFSWEKADPTGARRIAARVLETVWGEGPTEAIVPFSAALTPILSAESSTVRRNTPRILDLVKSCARLHYKQRRVVSVNGKEGVVAEPMDLAIVLYVGQRALSAILSTIPEKVKEVLDICKELASAGLPVTSENVLSNAGDRKAVLGSKRTVRRCISVLAERGVLNESAEKQGKLKAWELQNAEEPLTLDIARILQDADAEYARWLSLGNSYSVREQTGHDLTVTDGQSANLTDSPPAAANSGSDGSRTTDLLPTEAPA